jgi:arylsulfatase A-like enzyme
VPRGDEDRRREPDLVLITVDALRPDHLGCYGYGRETSPAADALARDGVLFENAFTPVPRTSPAVASMMTGLYPRDHGVHRLWEPLGPGPATLAGLLREEGYVTGAVVTRNLHHQSGIHRGFDTYQDNAPYLQDSPLSRAERLADMAADWVARHRGTKFFLWLHLWDPHFLYWPPRPYRTWFDPKVREIVPLYLRLARGETSRSRLYFGNDLTDEEVDRVVALYDGEIRYADEAVGRFLARLRSLGLYDSTLIVFSSDHGESLGEHGYFFEHGEYLYDTTLRIPLIVKYPASRSAGTRVPANVTIMDIMPTMIAAGGALIPSVEGQDLSLYLDGGRPHSHIYARTGGNLFPDNPRRHLPGWAGDWRSVRAGHWKLIQIPRAGGSDWELYDTASDPGETRNLYAEEDAVAAGLRGRLEAWDWGPGPEAVDRSGLDGETLEMLRSLGYVD